MRLSGRRPLGLPKNGSLLSAVRAATSAAPALSLDFTSGMPAGVTVLSSPAGYAPKADGSLTSFAANAGRRTNAGLLVEAASTNILWRSKSFTSNPPWQQERCSATDNAAVAPDGSTTAGLLTEDGTTGTHDFKQDAAGFAGGAGTRITVYLKAVGRNWAEIQGNGGNATSTYFDLVNGVVGSSQVLLGSNNVQSASISSAGNGWWKCSVIFTENINQFFIGGATGNLGRSYAGNSSPSIYVWNPSSAVGSVIDSAGANGTRSADQIQISIPVGITKLTYTFDDNSTQLVTGVSAGTYTIPTTLNRAQIKSIVGS